MDIFSIHDCSKISAQNFELKQKLQYLKRKYAELHQKFEDLSKETGPNNPIKSPLKHVSVQTDQKYWRPFSVPLANKADKIVLDADVAKTKKVLEMHSQLLSRYDKEVKLNMTYTGTISELNVRIGELEQKLREEKDRTLKLEREIFALKGRKSVSEDPVLRDVVAERNKLAKENKKLKDELKSLDHNFFDDIEDLKYALLQSAKLNSGYEKTLNKICSKFGLPVPPPEKILHHQSQK